MALSTKLELACREYLIDLNWSKAMQRAGYKKSTAENNGSKYFERTEIQTFINELMGARVERLERDGDDVVKELGHIAYSNLMDVYEYKQASEEDPYAAKELVLKDLETLPRSVISAIKDVKITAATSLSPCKVEIKFYSRLQALELLGRHHNIFEKGANSGVEFHMSMDLGGSVT